MTRNISLIYQSEPFLIALPEQRKQTRRIEPGEIDELLAEMRSHVPKPGTDFVKAISVVVRGKDTIPEHSHPEHTVLYYIEPTGPVVINGKPYHPERGEFLYLKPNVPHSVPSVSEPRHSIAMLVAT
jgi:quercetin dioxygenase-like cupin family protein